VFEGVVPGAVVLRTLLVVSRPLEAVLSAAVVAVLGEAEHTDDMVERTENGVERMGDLVERTDDVAFALAATLLARCARATEAVQAAVASRGARRREKVPWPLARAARHPATLGLLSRASATLSVRLVSEARAGVHWGEVVAAAASHIVQQVHGDHDPR
jgi:hypothetical protein